MRQPLTPMSCSVLVQPDRHQKKEIFPEAAFFIPQVARFRGWGCSTPIGLSEQQASQAKLPHTSYVNQYELYNLYMSARLLGTEDQQQQCLDAFDDAIAPYKLRQLSEYGDRRYIHWAICELDKPGAIGRYLVVIGGETREFEAWTVAYALAEARRQAQQEIKERLLSILGLE